MANPGISLSCSQAHGSMIVPWLASLLMMRATENGENQGRWIKGLVMRKKGRELGGRDDAKSNYACRRVHLHFLNIRLHVRVSSTFASSLIYCGTSFEPYSIQNVFQPGHSLSTGQLHFHQTTNSRTPHRYLQKIFSMLRIALENKLITTGTITI